jgi:hypothetical protein
MPDSESWNAGFGISPMKSLESEDAAIGISRMKYLAFSNA